MKKVIFILQAMLFISQIYADAEIISNDPERKATTIIKQDINGDLRKETIELIGKKDGDYINWQLKVTSLEKTFTSFNVLGLSARNGSLSIISSNSDQSYIVIDGPIGENGWILSIYSLTNNNLKRLNWIFSDRPYVELKDITKDGVVEIITFNRDYTTDPEKQNYVYTYAFDVFSQSWILHSAQNPETGEMIARASFFNNVAYVTLDGEKIQETTLSFLTEQASDVETK